MEGPITGLTVSGQLANWTWLIDNIDNTPFVESFLQQNIDNTPFVGFFCNKIFTILPLLESIENTPFVGIFAPKYLLVLLQQNVDNT